MTFNEGANVGSGRVSRRGRNGAIAGGGGIVTVIAVFLIGQFTGIDLSGLIGGGGGAPATEEELNCTVEQANADDECRVEGAAASLETYWAGIAPELGFEYVSPNQTYVFDGATETGCGSASAAVGPFYCPADSSIYLDTSFYADLRSKFGASGGNLAQMYIIAHEWGHHIQHISGITEGKDLQVQGEDSDSVRLELQADCFAGAWVGAASEIKDEDGTTFLKPVTQQEINDALNAAAAVGDDNIQEKTQGQVNPEGWTHGSSESRQKWFEAGRAGGPNACNTFEVAGSAL
jgi:predicted metalloprotease